MLDGLLGKGWERKKRDGIDLENGGVKEDEGLGSSPAKIWILRDWILKVLMGLSVVLLSSVIIPMSGKPCNSNIKHSND